jgi:hypothetical protein
VLKGDQKIMLMLMLVMEDIILHACSLMQLPSEFFFSAGCSTYVHVRSGAKAELDVGVAI